MEHVVTQRDAELRIKNIFQLEECTFDESVKNITERMRKAFCSFECSHSMAEKCDLMKDNKCKYLDLFFEYFVE